MISSTVSELGIFSRLYFEGIVIVRVEGLSSCSYARRTGRKRVIFTHEFFVPCLRIVALLLGLRDVSKFVEQDDSHYVWPETALAPNQESLASFVVELCVTIASVREGESLESNPRSSLNAHHTSKIVYFWNQKEPACFLTDNHDVIR